VRSGAGVLTGDRVSRPFTIGRTRIEGLIEAFNVTNQTNVVTVNGNFGSGEHPANPASNFGAPTALGDPRCVQPGFRVQF
jgi:hypothetical protein